MAELDPLQSLIDSVNAHFQHMRSTSQMTLGQLIQRLTELPSDTPINLDNPHSYRGYYSDLAFESMNESIPAITLLDICTQRCMGKMFQGYKGGRFLMGENTPVWVTDYGSCGEKLIHIIKSGIVITQEDD